LKEVLELMNDQGCGYLKLNGLELTVPNPLRVSLKEAFEQKPSLVPEHKVKMSAVDRELFPEDHPADEGDWS
jgi:hypothetical protein